MAILEGRYKAKISTVFNTVEEVMDEIKRNLKKARRIRIGNIPMDLLEDLKLLLKDQDFKIILSLGEKAKEELKKLDKIATTKARICIDTKGK